MLCLHLQLRFLIFFCFFLLLILPGVIKGNIVNRNVFFHARFSLLWASEGGVMRVMSQSNLWNHTYPSLNPTFFPKWEVSVYIREEVSGQFAKILYKYLIIQSRKSVINLTHASSSLSFVRTKLNHEAS